MRNFTATQCSAEGIIDNHIAKLIFDVIDEYREMQQNIDKLTEENKQLHEQLMECQK